MIYKSNKNEEFIRNTLEIIKRGDNPKTEDLKELLERSYHILKNSSYDNFVAYNLGLSCICHVANLAPKDSLIQSLLRE